MQRTREGIRARWSTRFEPVRVSSRSSAEDRAAKMYAASRRHPLSTAARAAARLDERAAGPYETSYDVLRGYAIERTIIRP